MKILTSELVRSPVFETIPSLLKELYFSSSGVVSIIDESETDLAGYFIKSKFFEICLLLSTASSARVDPEAGRFA